LDGNNKLRVQEQHHVSTCDSQNTGQKKLTPSKTNKSLLHGLRKIEVEETVSRKCYLLPKL